MKDKNIRPCEHCKGKTTFERTNENDPHEGDMCGICGDWVCINCVDWEKSGYKEDIVCRECGKNLTIEDLTK